MRSAAAAGDREVIGDERDGLRDGGPARRLSPYLLEVEGADHGLQVPGPLGDSIGVLGRVIGAMEEFLDAIG